MSDLISRQAVIEELHQYFSVGFDSDRYWNSTHVLQAIANVPSVEPKENGMKYCPHCGAKMKIISTNTKKETGDTYSRGSNIPTPNKRPPMPPVKHQKENERQEQKRKMRMDKQYIDRHEAYMLIKHEAETHELPASKEAYERAARIVDQMRPEELDMPYSSECGKEISNVKIIDVSLTMADHGCLTFFITVKGGSIGVSIGGYCIGHGYLGAHEFKSENGTGLVAMMKIMDVVGVTNWEDLKGKYCRIKSDGWGSRVTTIGNIIDDKWFDIGEFFKNAQ